MTTEAPLSLRKVDALGLAEQLVEEATSRGGVYYDVAAGSARIRAAQLGIGDPRRARDRQARARPWMTAVRLTDMQHDPVGDA